MAFQVVDGWMHSPGHRENILIKHWQTEGIGVYVARDGSVFVTSGGVNPTSTIQALALYIDDEMKSRLANLFD